MKYLIFLTIFSSTAFKSSAQQTLQSPAEFLGYELGDRFTRHHRVVEYFKHVAAVMPNAEVVEYGETYEHRPLIYLVITSDKNFKNLEEIRRNNLKRSGLLEGNPSTEKKAIIWLSYNVHGNESNSMEASMWTLYELANPENEKTREWIENTVVIIDPCVNPDGRRALRRDPQRHGQRQRNDANCKPRREIRSKVPAGVVPQGIKDFGMKGKGKLRLIGRHRFSRPEKTISDALHTGHPRRKFN